MTLTEFKTAHPTFMSYVRTRYGGNPRALRHLIAGRYLIVGYEHRGLREYRIFAATATKVAEVGDSPLSTIEAATRHAWWHDYERHV